MKSYTDLEQSKQLAKFLPLESADMGWYYSRNPQAARNQMCVGTKAENADIPCWSLAALLNVLYFPSLHKTFTGWRCDSYNKKGTVCEMGESADNSVDACFEMILKLHELKKI